MVALITLTAAGVDSGPFNLYSDVDGFTVPFGPALSQAVLLAGYISNVVPNGTTVVRVLSTGACKNYIDIPLELPDPMACGATVNLTIIGGFGTVEDSIISLNSGGGVVSIIATPLSEGVKFELIHNGVKKATSGMTVANEGPFDNVYGVHPNYLVPTNAQSILVDQFIDTGKGAVPTRNATYTSETGIGYISAPANSQMVWWKYTATDFINTSTVVLRVTTDEIASYDATNACETTTTTTTIISGQEQYNITAPFASSAAACGSSTYVGVIKSFTNPPGTGVTVYQGDGVTPFVGGNQWYKINPDNNTALLINNAGLVTGMFLCS